MPDILDDSRKSIISAIRSKYLQFRKIKYYRNVKVYSMFSFKMWQLRWPIVVPQTICFAPTLWSRWMDGLLLILQCSLRNQPLPQYRIIPLKNCTIVKHTQFCVKINRSKSSMWYKNTCSFLHNSHIIIFFNEIKHFCNLYGRTRNMQ